MKHRQPIPRLLLPLAAILALIGHHAFHADEPPAEEPFQYDRTESVLFVNFSAPQGTVLPTPTATLPVEVIVERHEWEIWKRPSTGQEEAHPVQVSRAAGVTVHLSGHLGFADATTVTTDMQGTAQTSFTADGTLGSPTITGMVGNSTSSLNFTQPGEDWTHQNTEGIIVASIEVQGGGSEITAGESRPLVLSVAYETWDVEISNYGNTRTVNRTNSPAVGAYANWFTESGDAYVSGFGITDGQGRCETSMVMGSVNSVVRADVTYATGDTTHATIHLTSLAPTPPPTENPVVYLRSETRPVIVTFTPDGATDVISGESRSLSGTVRWDVWDIWGNGTGPEEERYNYSYAATSVPVDLTVEQGDGSLSSPSAVTDSTGTFTTAYQMGSAPARITASVSGAAQTMGIDLVPTPPSGGSSDPDPNSNPDPGNTSTEPQWQFLETRGKYTLHGPNADGPTYDLPPATVSNVSVNVTWDSWDVLIDPVTGDTRDENPQSAAASSVPVEFTLTQGDGIVGDNTFASVTTSGGGEATTTFTMAAQVSRVTATIPGTGEALSIDFTPPGSGTDTFQKVRNEGLITLSLSTDPPGASVAPGSTVPVTAYAHAETWEVWENPAGQTELRNQYEGPAIFANVDISAAGSGSFAATTDSAGNASTSVTIGSDPITVTATVSFRGVSAYGELVITPIVDPNGTGGGTDPNGNNGGTNPNGTGGGTDPNTTGTNGTTTVDWTWQYNQDELLVNLDPGTTAGTLDVSVQLRTYGVWTHPNVIDPDIRTVSVGPAANALVQLSTSAGTATFAVGPYYTAADGHVLIPYSATSSATVQATAEFAGLNGNDGVMVAAADGLGGGSGGGNGSGETGGTGSGNNNSGGTTTTGTNNTTPTNTTPDLPTPSIRLLERVHSAVNDGYYEGGGDSTTVTVQMFKAIFAEPQMDSDGNPLDPIIHVVRGERAVKSLIILGKEALGWVHDPNLDEDYDEDVSVPNGGANSWVQGPYGIYGFATPLSLFNELVPLLTAEEMDSFGGEGEPQFLEPFLVEGGLRTSFYEHPWDETLRALAMTLPRGSDPFRAISEYDTGATVPTVSWTEVWLGANHEVPKNKGPLKMTCLIQASSREGVSATPDEWFGTITFEVKEHEMVSTSLPTLTWISPGAPTSWVHVDPTGFVRLCPTVERGKVNEVRLLPVEVVQPKLDENLEAVKDGNGNDELLDPGHLRFCRWRDAFPKDSWKTGSHQFDNGYIEKDRDRVVIRIPGEAFDDAKQILSVFVRTEDKTGAVVDAETEVEFTRNSENDFEFALALMTIEFDDHYDPAKFPTPTDEDKNDPTYYGTLGGKLVIRIPDLEDAEIEKPLMGPRATVDVKVYLMANTNGNIANFSRIVREDFQMTEEIFAQLGIELKLHTEFFSGPPLTWPKSGARKDYEEAMARIYDGDKIKFGYRSTGGHYSDLDDIITITNTPRKPSIPVIFYLDGTLENLTGTRDIRGNALAKDSLLAHGCAAVSATDSQPHTLAHELGHLLGLALGPGNGWVAYTSHYPTVSQHFLMCDVPEFETSPVDTSLRFAIRDERWLFEFIPDRIIYDTAKSFIKKNGPN